MIHHARPATGVYAGIAAAATALFLHVGYWIAGPLLLTLLLCAYPQSYELGEFDLIVNDALTRRRIPYRTMTAAERDGRRVRLRYGVGSELVITPADTAAFLEALAPRMPRERWVEYSFARTRRAWRTS
jgi:hypothetical protein